MWVSEEKPPMGQVFRVQTDESDFFLKFFLKKTWYGMVLVLIKWATLW